MRDSPRFRRRIFSWFKENLPRAEVSIFSELARQELGVSMPSSEYAYNYEDFFVKGLLRDVLDAISIVDSSISEHSKDRRDAWRAFVSRVFEEEMLGYVLDKRAGVRYAIDEEYERNRFSVIDGLSDSRYAAVREAVETAFSRLDGTPDTKAAVRDMFEAAEILGKLLTDSNEDLNERLVQRRLKPIAQRLYEKNKAAVSFSDQLLEAFAKWVNAGHKYRHGQQTEEPLAPPLDLAVAYLSSGASYVRVLADLDGRQREQT
jgi:hypothetical protein